MTTDLKRFAENISVVIPVYNKAKYIDRCITSVLNQTLNPGQIIVIDDGSTDESLKILREKYSHEIVLKSQENGGESIARNNGVALAVNPYVAFLDGDDEWRPTFIEEICKLMLDYPDCNLFATAYLLKSKGSEVIPKYRGIPENYRGAILDYFSASLNGWSIFSSSSTVVSKALFDQVGKFTPKLRLGADLDLWCRLSLKGKIAFLNQPHAIYHYFNDSSVTNGEIMFEELRFSKQLTIFLEKNQVPKELESSVRRFIAKGLQNMICENAKQGRYNLLYRYLGDKRFYGYFGKSTLKMVLSLVLPERLYDFIKRNAKNT